MPIATIHGERDPVVLPAMSALVARLRPDVTARSIRGAGHLPWLEAPEELDAALAALIG